MPTADNAIGSGSQPTQSRLSLNRLIEQQASLQQSTERIEKMVSELQEAKAQTEGRRQKLPKELSVRVITWLAWTWTL